jgi:hypothetical protein
MRKSIFAIGIAILLIGVGLCFYPQQVTTITPSTKTMTVVDYNQTYKHQYLSYAGPDEWREDIGWCENGYRISITLKATTDVQLAILHGGDKLYKKTDPTQNIIFDVTDSGKYYVEVAYFGSGSTSFDITILVTHTETKTEYATVTSTVYPFQLPGVATTAAGATIAIVGILLKPTSMPPKKFCIRCGKDVPPGVTFCPHCGQKVE